MQRFEGKVVLITGAASGIGRETAIRIASEGGTIAAFDVNAEALGKTVAALEASGATAASWVVDVRDEGQVKTAVDEVVERFGGLHALCNVAGILHVENSHQLALADWDRVISVNLTGTFLMCRAAIPHLLAKRGSIVNTSSTAAIGSHPWMAAYAASKGGVLALTRCLAAEYVKQKLNVNAVVPGGFATPIQEAFGFPEGADPTLINGAMPKVRMGHPRHAASVIAFLASDDARYMSGSEVLVDGGALN
jgi:meso-butanediol dehydrogenase / (S,S)-butanediol dehydrogenase / diacetyl reductase